MSIKKFQSFPLSFHLHRPKPRFKKVVVIEKDKVDLYICKTIIKSVKLSRKIETEKEAKAFIEQLKNTQLLSDVPELIFVDPVLKDKDGNVVEGYSFFEEFNQLSDFIRDKCKIVVVTSSEKREDKRKALMHPCVVRYLVKPLDVNKLKDFMFT